MKNVSKTNQLIQRKEGIRKGVLRNGGYREREKEAVRERERK